MGDVPSVFTRIESTGHTSIVVHVEVIAAHDPTTRRVPGVTSRGIAPRSVSTFCPARAPKAMRYVMAAASGSRSGLDSDSTHCRTGTRGMK